VNPFAGRFEIGRGPQVAFGHGRFSEVAAVVAGHGRRCLVVTGRRAIRESPRWGQLSAGLADVRVEAETLVVTGEPTPELVDQSVARFAPLGIDVVLGVGGGSVLDTAKAIAGLLRTRTSVLDHLEGVGRGIPYRGPAVPFVAVPTTAGTGSEATRNAVISRPGPGGFKRSFRDEQLVARDAVVDPDLLAGLPPELIAINGMDALTQLLESYVSQRASPFTDPLALAGLEAARDGLVPWCEAVRGGLDDLAGRSRMAFAALASGITLAHAGLGAGHGLAAALGGRFPIPHGAACGATVVAATRANVNALRERVPGSSALPRYATVGRLLAADASLADDRAVDALIAALVEWTQRLAIPGLAAFGVGEGDVDALVADSRGSSMRTNPIELTDDELAGIVRTSL
jgi:alcohol dehydrogenase